MSPLLVAAGATVTTLLGGWAAQRVSDRRHLVLGLTAGLMLGIIAFDLLPEALTVDSAEFFGVSLALLLFVSGFLALHIAERSMAIHRAHEDEYRPHQHPGAVPHRHSHGSPNRAQGLGIGAAGALVGHSFMDGFAIGAASQAGGTTGTVVAVAVISHDFADGFNTYTIMQLYGNDRRRGLALVGADAIAPMAGAAVTLAFAIPERILGLYLAFFAGFLLYLATSDILPEAHTPHPSRPTLLLTVAGTAFMWLVIGLAR
ncbi:ZIP family metal transporter [Streptacidiphilus sp. ASG 303]|uniref:ZIP family metal transporter n=1 Tax=Streptacidiphilus sp. ASG 303 TaxID=2896847 RepID=UPI001E62A897|nr:ZIP family metal transporter [Streptacidiphilus sp. ASG 303]MCD0484127.1 ZIP family metal transporter [Streptacidiphilus sp. ASG 303]